MYVYDHAMDLPMSGRHAGGRGALAALLSLLVAAGCGSSDKSVYGGADGGAGTSGGGGSAGSAGSAGSGGAAGTGGGSADCRRGGSCAGATPLCDADSGACVQCLADVHCPDGRCVSKACQANKSCTNSRDCVGAQQGTICDPSTQRCVECADAADCAGTADCLGNRCVPYQSCGNSRDCKAPQVCDPSRQRCVDCVDAADCPEAGQECEAHRCVTRRPCQSDNQCTPQGQLCNRGLGYCVDCLQPQDCLPGYRCSASGSCEVGGCTPNALSCSGASVVRCAADGSSTSVVETCAGACRDGACVAQLCTPGAPVCNGDVATRCSADGMSYQSGGTNCAASSQSCVDGSCKSCGGAQDAGDVVRLVELNIGTQDHVILENRGACPVDLRGLQLRFVWGASAAETLNFTLPSTSLSPGSKLVVTEGTANPGELSTGSNGNISFAGGDSGSTGNGGYVLLCRGACATPANVVDALQIDAGLIPPALPAPLSFSPAPISGVTATTENTRAFVRAAFAGSAPSFLRSDWAIGAASRAPLQPGTCPATAPVNGGGCSYLNNPDSCVYGAVTCTCMLTTWLCQ